VSSLVAVWTFGSGSPSNADYGVQHQPPSAWLLMTSAPVVLSGYETKIGSCVSECEAHHAEMSEVPSTLKQKLAHELANAKLIALSDVKSAIKPETRIGP
jgi:hypothetical protein